MRLPVRAVTAGVLAAGLLVACSGDSEDAELVQDPDPAEEVEPGDDDEGAPLGDDPETDPAPESSTRGGEFLDGEVDVAQEHPGGASIELRGVRFEGTAVLVDGVIANDGDGDIVVPVSSEADRLRLVDDLGGIYDYVHPDDDADETIGLEPGASLEGPLGFVGPVDEEASTLRLVMNVEDPAAYDPGEREPASERPQFVLDEFEIEAG